MVNNPYDTVSDTFYFVEDKLIMHNKAYYRYFVDDDSKKKESKGAAESKTSEVINYLYETLHRQSMWLTHLIF